MKTKLINYFKQIGVQKIIINRNLIETKVNKRERREKNHAFIKFNLEFLSSYVVAKKNILNLLLEERN